MPESFWQFSHKSGEKWSDSSILHMLVWICLNLEPELDGLWKIGHSIVRWDLASHDWISIQKKLPKSIKKALNPTFEVTSHLMFAAKFFKTWRCTNQINVINCSPLQNGASMLSEVWDQKEDFGLKWKRAQVKARVSSSYKVQASVVWI